MRRPPVPPQSQHTEELERYLPAIRFVSVDGLPFFNTRKIARRSGVR
jgi:hypothetical protein